MRDRIIVTSGLKQGEPAGDKGTRYRSHFLNGRLKAQLSSGFNFCAPRSLAIQMIGTYNQISALDCVGLSWGKQTWVFLIRAANAPTPPRSPPDIPSTSSMIKHDFEVISTPAALTGWAFFRE